MSQSMNLLEYAAPQGDATQERTAENTLTLSAPADAIGAGVAFVFEGAARDWSQGSCLAFTLRVNGAHRLRLHFTHGQGTWTIYLIPRPGLTSLVVIPFEALRERQHNSSHPGYSRFGGGPEPVDLTDVRELTLTFNQIAPLNKEAALGAVEIRSDVPEPALLDPEVVVDPWGQWIGERGAPRSEAAIRAAWGNEATTFTGFPGHTDATGADARRVAVAPATGFFQVSEVDGRWLLLDPEGFPFFSMGCDCVRPQSEGPVSGGREALFADLTDAQERSGSPTSDPWQARLWADFYKRNLRRRYEAHGGDWHEPWSCQVATRLRTWGFNTIANWSDPALTRRGLMPYVTAVSALGPLCGHLPDVYAPGFDARVRALVEPEVALYRGDRMLIGFFVGNEPHWTFGGHRHPFNTVLVSPEEYPHTRQEAIRWTRQTYGENLSRLNAAWGTAFSSWEDLTRSSEAGGVPDVRLGSVALKQDAHAFMGQVLGAFYDICCRGIRAVDPDHLLLGGRFYSPNLADPYVRACRSFDVYSFNLYNWNAPADAIRRITELSGRPVLIGEFHYGVEGRGLTASLVATASQEERGLAYRHFVENAAALPQVVGVHWFQWVDQPVTGRFDGECYNIGLVDITDVPYEEFLAPVRETHARLYDLCHGAIEPYVYPGQRPSAW